MKLLSFMQRVSTGKVVLALIIPAIIVYFIMVLYTIPQVSEYAPGINLFDLSLTGYSFEYAVKLLDTLGSEGRELYLYRQLPLDFIYPGLFAVSCSLLLSWLFQKTHETNSRLFYFCYIPVAAGLFDYLENIFIASILTSYPNVSEVSIFLASSMTIAKSVLTTAFFVLLIIGVILNLKKNYNKPLTNNN
ncbi:MAG: hypothetical protein NZ735_05005 [Candidatus Marinimicrobia bacterium]|nr:hypothetical protein [Candidatus Neomarinimicrobiota bacterium]